MNLIDRLKGECQRFQFQASTLIPFLLTVTFLILAMNSPARPGTVDSEAAVHVARNWIEYSAAVLAGRWNGSAYPHIGDSEALLSGADTLALVFQIEPSGYVVVAKYREITPVIAYSTTERLDLEAMFGFARVLRSDLLIRNQFVRSVAGMDEGVAAPHGVAEAIQENHDNWDLWASDVTSFRLLRQDIQATDVQDVGPLLLSTWHQQSPYYLYCPIGDNNNHCVVGCVATATAQIMYYWQWPPAGTESHSYWWDGDGPVPAQWLTADFSDPYDWGNILLTYSGGYTQAEADAVAELCYEVGVAFEMDYGASGSGAYTNRSITMLPQHFSYMSTIVEESRSNHTAETWFSMIQPEIDASRPLLYRFYEGGWGTHAIVCDGWRDAAGFDQLHFNYGWGGSFDNWYNVDELYPLSTEYIDHQQAYRGIQPRLQIPPEVALTAPVQNELNVPVAAEVSVTFDTEMDPSTLNNSSFTINCLRSGPHDGIIDYDSATTTATFISAADFLCGDEVLVLLTKGVASAEGCCVLRSYQWSFTAGVAASDGEFSEVASYAVAGRPISVVAADLNGDGHTDLAVVSEDTSEVTVLLNNGIGEFTPGLYCQCLDLPSDVCAADFDADGDVDLSTANRMSDNISIIKNNGDATFGSPVSYPLTSSSGPTSIVAADFDGDGRMDLATANSGHCAVTFLPNGGPGSFWRRTDYLEGAPEHLSICSADMNNDGRTDMIAANPQEYWVDIFFQQWQEGTFEYPISRNMQLPSQSVITADLNADGFLDIVTADTLTNLLSVILNVDGSIYADPVLYATGDNPRSVIATDCNGDGDLDLIHTLPDSSSVSVLYNDGNGSFGAPAQFSVGALPEAVIAADLDGDGDNDLVTANTASNSVSVLFNELAVDIVLTTADQLPRRFELFQNYPNPFNPTTKIKFALSEATVAKLEVYNIMGQKISTLCNKRLEAGYHSATWNAESRASGVYFFRLKAGDFEQTRKMILMK